MEVIQLEWSGSDNEIGWLGANTPFGTLTIYHDEEVDNYYTGSDNYPYLGDSFETLEEAKQNLQEWFESLVQNVLKTCVVDK